MNVIIHSIREGAGEIGQIDLSQIAHDKYTSFAQTLNKIAGAQLVPSSQPSKNSHFPATVNHRIYFTCEQEAEISLLLKTQRAEKQRLLKTFFVNSKPSFVACAA